MGRGNVCTFGKYEGLFYLDWDKFIPDDEDGNPDPESYEDQRFNYECDRDSFVEDFCNKFTSFMLCDKWMPYPNRERHVIAENKLYYLIEVDNEWSMAIMLIQKEDDWGLPIENLQKKHFQAYFNGLRDVLFNYYDELGTYGGAWTSGSIKRTERKVS